MRKLLPIDFAAALLLALLANGLVASRFEPPQRERMRTRSYGRMVWKTATARAPVDLAVIGDSRSRRIDAEILCEALDLSRCLNLSSSAGDWITSYELYSRLEPKLAPGGIVLLGVSDYWLEMGGHHPRGILPESTAYVKLGDPISTIASYLPLSVSRGSIAQRARDAIEETAGSLYRSVTGRAPPPARRVRRPRHSSLEKGNVDRWFAETNDTDRHRQIALARGVLERLSSSAPVLALVYMPNPVDRDRYVDRYYPDRRARFFTDIHELAREFDIPMIDLSGRLPDARHYRDFHHLDDKTVPRATRMVAAEIERVLAGDAASHAR